MLRESLSDNDQLIVHTVGYPATVAMLDAMQSAGGPKVWATRRLRFEHGDGLTPDLIPRSKAMGIVVVQNPTHFAAANLNPNLAGIFEGPKPNRCDLCWPRVFPSPSVRTGRRIPI